MGAVAGSLLASSAITGGSLTGWGSALAWLPIAALPRRWELLGFGSAAFPSKGCVCGVTRRLEDVSRGFSTGSGATILIGCRIWRQLGQPFEACAIALC
jgi:hypothetical protein